jgi:phosphatidylinositol-3-phosphatase
MRIGRLSVSALVLAVGFGIAPAGPAALAAGYQPTAAGTAATTAGTSTVMAARTAGAASAVPLCGSMAGTRPHITKVMWIFMENRSYGKGPGQIPGDPSAKYIGGTLIRHCGSTSDYHAITHPSFPNYLAATSGGLHGDGSQHSYSVRSIFSQVDPSWRSYEEFMPVPCDHVPQVGNPATGQYYVNRHNPAAFYSSEPVSGDCTQFDRRLGSKNTGALARAVSAGKLPRFSFVTPGLCDDMHLLPPGVAGCANPTASGDAWLATWIPIITAGRDYQKGRLVIDITWDEGNGGTLGADCLTSNAANCIVPDIVISPYTRHKVASRDLSHYSLLKMTERLLGLHFLGRARNTTVRNLCKPFGLCPRRH